MILITILPYNFFMFWLNSPHWNGGTTTIQNTYSFPIVPMITKTINIASNNDQCLDSHILMFCYGQKKYEVGKEKHIKKI
jgi:hypothetical protein